MMNFQKQAVCFSRRLKMVELNYKEQEIVADLSTQKTDEEGA